MPEPRRRREPADGNLSELLRRNLRHVHWTRIETGALSPGLPDLEGCAGGHQLWVELKQTRGLAVVLRPLQVGWHLRRARAGGRSWVLVRRRHAGSPRRPPCDDLLLYAGAQAADLGREGTRLAPDGGCWTGGPGAWPGAAVLGVMCRPAR